MRLNSSFELEAPIAEECVLCAALSGAAKDAFPSLRSSLPSSSVEWQTSILRRLQIRLVETFQSGRPLNGPERLLREAEWIIGDSATDLLREEDPVLRTAGHAFMDACKAAIGRSLRESSLSSSPLIPDYFSDSTRRSLGLMKQALTDLGLPAPSASSIQGIEVFGLEGAQPAAYYRDGWIYAGYATDELCLLRMFAQPLFVFHEIFSHSLPPRRLSSKCTEGWLLDAAKRLWQRAKALDDMIWLEFECLMQIVVSPGQWSSRWHGSSPYISTPQIFCEHFPELFWQLTASLLTLDDDRPLEELLLEYLRRMLCDSPEPARKEEWLDALRTVAEEPWRSLEHFVDRLREAGELIDPGFSLAGSRLHRL